MKWNNVIQILSFLLLELERNTFYSQASVRKIHKVAEKLEIKSEYPYFNKTLNV
jgi:hypothetical protein